MDIILTDVDGVKVIVDSQEINRAISRDGSTIFGIGIKEIRHLHKEYMALGGKLPITEQNIDEWVTLNKGE